MYVMCERGVHAVQHGEMECTSPHCRRWWCLLSACSPKEMRSRVWRNVLSRHCHFISAYGKSGSLVDLCSYDATMELCLCRGDVRGTKIQSQVSGTQLTEEIKMPTWPTAIYTVRGLDLWTAAGVHWKAQVWDIKEWYNGFYSCQNILPKGFSCAKQSKSGASLEYSGKATKSTIRCILCTSSCKAKNTQTLSIGSNRR